MADACFLRVCSEYKHPCLPPLWAQARQRLEFRLQEKDRQMGKLRGAIQELEGKLVEAYKRQANL